MYEYLENKKYTFAWLIPFAEETFYMVEDDIMYKVFVDAEGNVQETVNQIPGRGA